MKNTILTDINKTQHLLDQVFFGVESLNNTSISQMKSELIISLIKESYRNALLARDLLGKGDDTNNE
ncbi:hypothetical protein [Siminovitchia fordii]|uniref:Uncharacterized protein n=1 Tax=Siminovitchia fordii TaxID=254759 RepID=A0ABQ4K9X3_9BACI|nr:hypothetical protein [Siminovitchia fordii]GIN22516.1 hypothetical protein J1TS3_36500 [Siminovitchia fordii]